MKRIVFSLLGVVLFSCATNSSSEINSSTSLTSFDVAVIYFSQTTHTEKIASYIAEYYSVDAIEVKAKVPYSEEDINYNNDSCRANQEQGDSSCRVEYVFTSSIENYDYIFLGYPIWWGDAPKLMYKFVEDHSFKNKTVIPFCTSASSSIGSSGKNLENLSDGGTWLDGKRFAIGESKENVYSYLDGLNFFGNK